MKKVCEIKSIGDITILDNNTRMVLSEAGVRVRKTNSVLISGYGKTERIRIKLDRKNIPYLSDKIRDLHQVLKAIYLSKIWDIPLEQVFSLMDKNQKDPIEIHHKKSTLKYDVSVLTKSEHDNLHRKEVLKSVRGE